MKKEDALPVSDNQRPLCQYCAKPRGQHHAKTQACPLGRRRGALGYLSFHNIHVFMLRTPSRIAIVMLLVAMLSTTGCFAASHEPEIRQFPNPTIDAVYDGETTYIGTVTSPAVQISNRGDAWSPSTITAWYRDGMRIGTVSVPAIAPGMSAWVSLNIRWPSTGRYTIDVLLDPYHQMIQLSSADDIGTFVVTVLPPSNS